MTKKDNDVAKKAAFIPYIIAMVALVLSLVGIGLSLWALAG